MKYIYVHGFLGNDSESELGKLLRAEAAKDGKKLHLFKWDSGGEGNAIFSTMKKIPSGLGLMETFSMLCLSGFGAALDEWKKAKNNVPEAAKMLSMEVTEDVCLIAFSMGAQVVKFFYQNFPSGGRVKKIVLAGAAIPDWSMSGNTEFSRVKKIINFYSGFDVALEIGYPIIETFCRGKISPVDIFRMESNCAAGVGGIDGENVKNIYLKCDGHFGYMKFAGKIWKSAGGDEIKKARKRGL
jgi:hypothetical protein